jgi:hypothetical protein
MIEQANQSSHARDEGNGTLSSVADLLQLLDDNEVLSGKYVSPEEYAVTCALNLERLPSDPVIDLCHEPNTSQKNSESSPS